ncbi:class II aldolase/adducin family protein [Dongia sedimenti]|uniref:Class II aldolase/adducin family protein n=1 Tax=Dongia sedimenti TaxID=3064282 RepID=A0ABU0YVE2_9PROT|nr:class II aldolase/adducin family protein [Rhodospirillaceae bacterium R-7]
MEKAELAARKSIIQAALSMNALGINQGTSGNVSVRYGERMLITPSGVPYEELDPRDLCATQIKKDGKSWEGELNPSSEWRFHLNIYQNRPDVGAIVHTHSTYATVLAICGKPIPAVHYMVAASGGTEIRIAKYATYGTEQLSKNALEALKDRTCCLLKNHGVIATGPNLKRALWLASEVETVARQYYLSLAIGGGDIIPDDEINRIIEGFKAYGPLSKPKDIPALKKPAKKAAVKRSPF